MIKGVLLVFYGKMFDDWKIKMVAIFGFQDAAEVVADELSELGSKITDEEKKNYKVQQRLDSKEQFLIYQRVSPKIFNKEEWGMGNFGQDL